MFDDLFHASNRWTQGWELSGITHFSTGLSVTVVNYGDNSLPFATSQPRKGFSERLRLIIVASANPLFVFEKGQELLQMPHPLCVTLMETQTPSSMN